MPTRFVKGINLRITPRGRAVYGANISLPRLQNRDRNFPAPVGGIEGIDSAPSIYDTINVAYEKIKQALAIGQIGRMVWGLARRNPMTVVSTLIYFYNISVSDEAIETIAETQVEMGLPGNPDPYYISGQFTF